MRYAVWAFGLSVAIVAALGIAIMVQQRHETNRGDDTGRDTGHDTGDGTGG